MRAVVGVEVEGLLGSWVAGWLVVFLSGGEVVCGCVWVWVCVCVVCVVGVVVVVGVVGVWSVWSV